MTPAQAADLEKANNAYWDTVDRMAEAKESTMRYMVLKHVRKRDRPDNLWYVADMHHPQLHGKVVMKPLAEAMEFCARMNAGTKYFDSRGLETVHDAMVRLYRTATAPDAWGLGTVHEQAVNYFKERGGPPHAAPYSCEKMHPGSFSA